MVNKATVHTAFLVDDNEVDLFIQKKFIELSSFAERVITFSSPIKALEVLQSIHMNDIIIIETTQYMNNCIGLSDVR